MVLKQLMYIAALAREQHFGRAARSCNVSQPTLSAAIRQLEQELNVPIVARGQRFVGFTPEGECVLDYARRILADCDAMRHDLGQLREGITGRLRLGVIPTALPIISGLTAPFRARYPSVTIAVLSLNSIEIQRGLDSFDLDVGITYLDNEPLERVRTMPLYREEYMLLLPADGRFADRTSVTWRDASVEPLCLLTPDMQNRRIIDEIFRSIGRQPRPVIETNEILNLCSYASSGHGSSIVPKVLLQIFGLPDGTHALPLVEPDATRTVGLTVADRATTSPLVRGMLVAAESFGIVPAFTEPGWRRDEPPTGLSAEAK